MFGRIGLPRWTLPGLLAVAGGAALLVAVPDESHGQSEALLETITVSADNGTPPQTSSTTLIAGQTYKVVGVECVEQRIELWRRHLCVGHEFAS